MKEDSLKKRYSIKLFASIISGLIGFVLIAIVPKALGAVAYGEFTYIQSFFAKFIGFLDLGTSTAFFTKLSANHTRKNLITFYIFYSISLLAVVFLFIYCVESFGFIDLFFPSISSKYVYMGVFFGFFIWFTQIFIKISDVYALTVSVELIKILHKIASLFLLAYFVYFTSFDLDSYFYFHYIALVSFFIILSWLFVKKGIFTKSILTFNIDIKSIIKEFYEYCSPLFLYSLLGIVVGFFDIWILQKISGSVETGFYGLAYSLAAMCFIFTSAMTPIITREFAKSYEQKDIKNMRRLFFRYIPMLYSVAAFISVFVSMQSENILLMFTDEQFHDAYLVLMVMAFYPIHQTYGQLSGSIFYATGQTKLVRNIAFISQPLGMVFTFILVYMLDLGALGLAIKMILVQIVGVSIQLYFNSKFLDFKMKYFVIHQIYAVVFFIVLAYISGEFIKVDDSPFVNFIFSGILYTLFVIISSYIFPQVFATTRDEIKQNLLRLRSVTKK